MQRTLVNLIVDLAVAFVMAGMLLTGYIIKFPLPPGTNKEWMLWGLTRHQWGEIHFWISTIVFVLIVVHICLHWNWLVTVIRQRCGLPKATPQRRLPDGWRVVAALVALFAVFVGLAHRSVKHVPEPRADACQDDVVVSIPARVQSSPNATAASVEAKLTWADVAPILTKSCLSCHGPRQQRANFRVDDVQSLLADAGTPAWILPGRSSASPLIAIVSGRREVAPASRHRLPDAEVARLCQWIDDGAAVDSPKGER